MTKKVKIAFLVFFAVVVAFLLINTLRIYNIDRADFLAHPEKYIALRLSKKDSAVSEDDINVIASKSNGKETFLLCEYDGEMMSVFASKNIILNRAALSDPVPIKNAGVDTDSPYYDPNEPIQFRLYDYKKSELYSYNDGVFTLTSTSKKLNEEISSLITRVVVSLVIVGVVLFSKTKKEE
ncbi:MAG: hypothetical protein IKI49_03750 [Oscillospiraceae bacterium]|nr:hypothetical protein [Oscillospiraceae bacterium]